jgi:hypothetical protein
MSKIHFNTGMIYPGNTEHLDLNDLDVVRGLNAIFILIKKEWHEIPWTSVKEITHDEEEMRALMQPIVSGVIPPVDHNFAKKEQEDANRRSKEMSKKTKK